MMVPMLTMLEDDCFDGEMLVNHGSGNKDDDD